MWKYKNNLLPEMFDSFFALNSSIHNYSTRQHNLYHVPIVKSELSRTFLKYTGVTLWNRMAKQVPHNQSLYGYKKQVKQYFLSLY